MKAFSFLQKDCKLQFVLIKATGRIDFVFSLINEVGLERGVKEKHISKEAES